MFLFKVISILNSTKFNSVKTSSWFKQGLAVHRSGTDRQRGTQTTNTHTKERYDNYSNKKCIKYFRIRRKRASLKVFSKTFSIAK